jgi:anthranilate phosphoribosyltransferase
VLHAAVGMDEISPSGRTLVWEIREGRGSHWELEPSRHGLACEDLDELAGGEPTDNAAEIERLLTGQGKAAVRCAALLNAAAALYVSGNGWSFDEAVERGQQSLKQGAAAAALQRLRAAAPRR